jgi:hypothetical protein
MTPLWIKPIKEGSSGFTGCTLFDFDDDGTVETVYRSESELLIIDGTDGSTRRSLPCISRTQEEYPIVADVDGDGASEICVTCYTSDGLSFNPYDPNTTFAQVRIYGAADGESWQPSRPVWNQSSYFNVNINDDLTVPQQLQDHTKLFSDGACTVGENRALNTFMVQSPVLDEDGCSSYVTPDLDVGTNILATRAQCPETEIEVTFDVSNQGDVAISGTIPVSFYAGDPFQPGATYLNTDVITITNLEVLEEEQFTATAQGLGGNYTLYLVLNDAGGTPPITFSPASVPECGDEENNVGFVDVFSDPFTLSVEKIFDNRKCSPGGDALPDNGQARAFYLGTLTTLETVYEETFSDLSIGATTDGGDSPWTRTVNSGATIASVQESGSNKRFQLRNGDVLWSTGPLDISGLTNVSITTDLFAEGPMETSGGGKDFLNVWYDLDGSTDTLNNGLNVGNFGYQSANAVNLSGNTLEVFVLLHNTGNGEDYFLDNVRVQGFSSSTQEFTEADGFSFEWYADATTDPGLTNILHSGSTYPSMAEGTYQVRGFYTLGNCFSTVEEVTIDLDQNVNFQVEAYEISSLTDCSSPNGEVTAFAYTFEESPGVPGDTLSDGFTFEWRFAAGGGVIGTADTLRNLDANQYRVTVQENLTGCVDNALVDVNTSLVDPDDIEVSANVTNIIACGGTGQASAFVDDDPGPGVTPNTLEYTFEWFDGEFEKSEPDFTGIDYTGLAAGFYTVRARQNSSNCVSTTFTVEGIF